MSEIKVNSIKGVSASSAAISINNTDGTCTANLTNRTNKNLIINGAFQIAQRGVSSTSEGLHTVDRFQNVFSGLDENATQAQADIASGTTPYTSGFRKSFKITNGNQTSGAGAADFIFIRTKLEAQDIANSGWNYTSTSSFVTLSFYVKSSVAQNFFGYLDTSDGTQKMYPFQTGSLSADTWTKITKTISGHADLSFNNDNGTGLGIIIAPFMGTDYTANSATVDAWKAQSDTERMPDNTSTWYTTNDATFEITGVQLEVSDHATDFEHRSFAQELALCQRYFHKIESGSTDVYLNTLQAYGSGAVFGVYYHFPVTMRATPTTTVTGTITPTNSAGNFAGNLSSFTFDRNTPDLVGSNNTSGGSGLSGGDATLIALRANTSASISSSAEL